MRRTWLGRQWQGCVRAWHWVGRRMPERLWLAWVLLTVVCSRDYRSARYAVRKVAVEGGPAIAEFGIARLIQDKSTLYPFEAENWYRNMEASLWTKLHAKETGRIPKAWRRELLVEMAYVALRERGR